MGFFNKVKNIFFEEEFVEVEEPKKIAKKEVPVAKKIELPKKEKVDKFEIDEEITETKKEENVKENKFPMDFSEDDFKEDAFKHEVDEKEETLKEQSFEEAGRRSNRYAKNDSTEREEEIVEEKETVPSSEPKYDFELEYGKEKEDEPHGLYEGKSPKKVFTPTPIISPIYGILDKNYKKDDVVTKKEIVLSSAPKKIDLDSVREKAYGDLTTDISQSMEDVEPSDYREEDAVDLAEDENLLYDLNDENSSPAIKEVTVGDAEEYFDELGLEYNIDYKDTSVDKKKAPGKEKEVKNRRTKVEEDDKTVEKDEQDSDDDDDLVGNNLFDLIESTLYEDKE